MSCQKNTRARCFGYLNLLRSAVLIFAILQFGNASTANAQNQSPSGGILPIIQYTSAPIVLATSGPVAVSNFVVLSNLVTLSQPPMTNHVISEPNPNETWKDSAFRMVPAISALCFLISIFYAIRSFRMASIQNQITLSRNARQDLDRMLLDSDRAYMATPELWSIYDGELRIPKSFEGKERIKRAMCLYLHFNMFVAAYNYYQQDGEPEVNEPWSCLYWLIGLCRRICFLNSHTEAREKIEADFWQAWNNYITQFFEHSTEARNLFMSPVTQEVYSKSFRKYVNPIIERFNRVAFSAQDITNLAQIVGDMKKDDSNLSETEKKLKTRLRKLLVSYSNDSLDDQLKDEEVAKEAVVQILNSMVVGIQPGQPQPRVGIQQEETEKMRRETQQKKRAELVADFKNAIK